MCGAGALRVVDLAPAELRSRLADNALVLRTGPFTTRLHSHIPEVARGLSMLYGDFPLAPGEFCDFHVRVDRVAGPRHWFRPQVNFWVDGHPRSSRCRRTTRSPCSNGVSTGVSRDTPIST